MPLQVARLRRWFALTALVLIVLVAGVYLHLRRGMQDVLKQVPGKIGVDIQQTATGFKISKSVQGRTLFTVEASKAVQFKQGGHTELHDVTITLFGRDSSRYDQIHGDAFEYDPRSGDVTAQGEVRIDLEANPEGIVKPDQAVPSNLRNPIRLVTRDLVFNQKSGDASTVARVDLHMPQVQGSAVGLAYSANNNLLRLNSQVQFVLSQAGGVTVTAARGAITKTPRQVVLESPRVVHRAETMTADRAVLELRDDNTLDRVIASGAVQTEIAGANALHANAQTAVLEMTNGGATLQSAQFSGDVRLAAAGNHPFEAAAERVLVAFAGKDVVSKIRAEQNVKLIQLPTPTDKTSHDAQFTRVEAPAIDFYLARGSRIERAETSAGAQIVMAPAAANGPRTVITAGMFRAKFGENGHLLNVQGEPDARIVSATPGQPDRASTSQSLAIAFAPTGGISSVTQFGNVIYQDADLTARAQRAIYTPSTQLIALSGSPRVTQKNLTTTARTMQMDRMTGDALAEGDVKSTYSDLREQPAGAMLAAASPIHVTAQKMAVHGSASEAFYTGNVRLWQDANVVQAPSIQFDQANRAIAARGNGDPVSTVLVQVDKRGNATPVTITSERLTYTDTQHQAQFEGHVVARGADVVVTAAHLDAYLVPRNQEGADSVAHGQGQVDRMVAQGTVVIQEPSRRALGDRLVYTAAEDKFVLTGGPPSIFDAEHGKITGDSLTFYKRDDRVLVEGKTTSPTVTTTRVAR